MGLQSFRKSSYTAPRRVHNIDVLAKDGHAKGLQCRGTRSRPRNHMRDNKGPILVRSMRLDSRVCCACKEEKHPEPRWGGQNGKCHVENDGADGSWWLQIIRSLPLLHIGQCLAGQRGWALTALAMGTATKYPSTQNARASFQGPGCLAA